MKFNFLQQVVGKIQNQMSCPRCKASLKNQNLDVCRLEANFAELTTVCPSCQNQVNFSVEVTSNKPGKSVVPVPVSPVVHKPITKKSLAASDLNHISSSLKGFSSQSVSDLFDKKHI